MYVMSLACHMKLKRIFVGYKKNCNSNYGMVYFYIISTEQLSGWKASNPGQGNVGKPVGTLVQDKWKEESKIRNLTKVKLKKWVRMGLNCAKIQA